MSVQKRYYDADGRELTEAQAMDRGVIRDGIAVRTSINLIDGVPAIFDLSDAERIFASSVKGQRAIALARRSHDRRERHKHQPQPFTDAHAAAVVRDELGIVDTLGQLQTARDAALAARSDRLNAWRR